MRRNTAALLVIIAALLAADIALRVSATEAVAQDQFDLEAARFPHVIQVETTSSGCVFRLWSDGVIEWAVFDNIGSDCLSDGGGFAWQEIAETVALPPGVRITRIYTRRHLGGKLVRLRSDGVVEQNCVVEPFGWCGWRTPPE